MRMAALEKVGNFEEVVLLRCSCLAWLPSGRASLAIPLHPARVANGFCHKNAFLRCFHTALSFTC